MMTSKRLADLRQRMAQESLPALLVTQPLNRYYLSGFSGSAGLLFITQSRALLLTDSRYVERAAAEAPDFEIVKTGRDLAQMLPGLLEEAAVANLGFESAHVTHSEHAAWAKVFADSTLVPTQGLVEGLRAVKSEDELALIRQAVRISDGAYEYLKAMIRPGMTEKEVAWNLEVWMRTHGAAGMAFDIIVGSGPNGAIPHALASGRRIQIGEPVVVDLGARVGGYHSDLTRTFCLGEADEKFNSVYDIVFRAQEAAEAAVRPGVRGADVDAIARNIITEAGYGETFEHGLGHGVGMAVHESPGLGQKSEDALAQGNVATVEPGIYISGWGGVRIEDVVLVTSSGVEVLTQAPKERVVPVGS